MAASTLSIIVPVYNEEGTLAEILDRVCAVELPTDRELVIVNDGSTDQSAGIITTWVRSNPGVRVQVLTQENQGKGAAVRAGITSCTGDLVIIQDADLEYDPNDYLVCIQPILEGRAQVVYGSRERFAQNHTHSSWTFYLGGMLVSFWFSLLYLRRITDEPTGYKVFRAELIRTLSFRGNGFEWEPEVTARLLRLGFRIHEVPIHYHPRQIHEGKKINARDGIRALWEALRWRVKSVAADHKKLADAGILPG